MRRSSAKRSGAKHRRRSSPRRPLTNHHLQPTAPIERENRILLKLPAQPKCGLSGDAEQRDRGLAPSRFDISAHRRHVRNIGLIQRSPEFAYPRRIFHNRTLHAERIFRGDDECRSRCRSGSARGRGPKRSPPVNIHDRRQIFDPNGVVGPPGRYKRIVARQHRARSCQLGLPKSANQRPPSQHRRRARPRPPTEMHLRLGNTLTKRQYSFVRNLGDCPRPTRGRKRSLRKELGKHYRVGELPTAHSRIGAK